MTELNLNEECTLKKSIGSWSSGTRVRLIEIDTVLENALVEHTATRSRFEYPLEYLLPLRKLKPPKPLDKQEEDVVDLAGN